MKSLVVPLITWLILCYTLISYLKIEIQTRAAPFSATIWCPLSPTATLSYAKVLSISTSHKKATLYCIYQDSRENKIVPLTQDFEGNWSPGQSNSLGNDWHWPLYF
jgi:hypothetical protein